MCHASRQGLYTMWDDVHTTSLLGAIQLSKPRANGKERCGASSSWRSPSEEAPRAWWRLACWPTRSCPFGPTCTRSARRASAFAARGVHGLTDEIHRPCAARGAALPHLCRRGPRLSAIIVAAQQPFPGSSLGWRRCSRLAAWRRAPPACSRTASPSGHLPFLG